MTQVLVLAVILPEVNEINDDFHARVVICRSNGFWPKLKALHQWILSTWIENYDIKLHSRGFFIVKFDTTKDKDYVLNEGSWFWGNASLFMTPWFQGFNANTMLVSKMSVWVRLHNLPLHFWHHKVLEGIWELFWKIHKGGCITSFKRHFHIF